VFFVAIASEAESQALFDLTRHAVGREAMRTWMILWSSQRIAVAQIALRLHCRPKTVRKWLHCFQRGRSIPFSSRHVRGAANARFTPKNNLEKEEAAHTLTQATSPSVVTPAYRPHSLLV
jgi:hypothetical protein